ncbi:MAG: ACP S-malonyltransferase [Candidatus Hydrothermales bacterium]
MVRSIFFTGQGSQFVSMGIELYKKNEIFKKIVDEAEKILEMPLKKLMFEGPEEELTLTKNAQPAILTVGVGKFEVYKEKNGLEGIEYALGHSLGEFGALYASEVLGFESVFKLVKIRGLLMNQAGEKTKGTMAVAIGMGKEEALEIIDEIKDENLVIANYNTQEQYIVSGPVLSIEKFMELSKKRGYKKVIKLNVSAAFHSPLMREAALEFEKYIDKEVFKKPNLKVIQNFTGKAHDDPDEIKENLKKQILSPVLFIDSVLYLTNLGVKSGIEFGPKPILKGLVARIDGSFSLEFFDGY